MGDQHHKRDQRVQNLTAELTWLEARTELSTRQRRRIKRIRETELPKAKRNAKT